MDDCVRAVQMPMHVVVVRDCKDAAQIMNNLQPNKSCKENNIYNVHVEISAIRMVLGLIMIVF